MSQIKFRLTLMNFLQFFVWGSYLTSLGGYLFVTRQFKGEEIGLVFMTMGIASVIMPTLLGIVADRWMNAERVLGISHVISAGFLFWSFTVKDPDTMFWVMLLVNMFYMPTIALNNSVSYDILLRSGLDPQKSFPPIRVWGTIGFIAAMWSVDLLGLTLEAEQLVFAGIAGVCMGVYSLAMPACPPSGKSEKKSLFSAFGLDAFVLFRTPKMLVFFLFAMFLGAALQVTNQWGVPFLDHFKAIPEYEQSFGVQHANILASISQISETLFILTIPFFLTRFGIKRVMLISIGAWVLRFGLFGIGNPGSGVALLVLSMIVYGMAFDFFNISGSLFVEREADKSIRSSAQGLFMLMTNGIGAIIGSYGSGWVVQRYTDAAGITDWSTVWYIFAAYALVLFIIFPFAFRYKHNPADVQEIKH
ncbi:MAG: nucleoside permease [Bacteroidetes bacterium]|nr:nucleoside permease [Bacteroidota bacterium]